MNYLFIHLDRRLRSAISMPSTRRMVRYFDYFMYGVALVSPIALLPQVIQLFWERDATGLSLPTWLLLGGINLLWAVYGAVHKQRPLLIASFLIGFLDLLIVLGILLYR